MVVTVIDPDAEAKNSLSRPTGKGIAEDWRCGVPMKQDLIKGFRDRGEKVGLEDSAQQSVY